MITSVTLLFLSLHFLVSACGAAEDFPQNNLEKCCPVESLLLKENGAWRFLKELFHLEL